MQLGLFYDTETTGLPRREPLSHPDQPRIVQLAACLVDLDTKTTISSMDVIIDPEKPIGAVATQVHGISTAKAQLLGITSRSAINLFVQLWRKASVRIAHNQQFDETLVAIALAELVGMQAPLYADWLDGKTVCTMQLANPLTAAEGSIGSKWPKLSEACQILMKREIVNAHSAMPDVLACMDLYFYCMEREALSQ